MTDSGWDWRGVWIFCLVPQKWLTSLKMSFKHYPQILTRNLDVFQINVLLEAMPLCDSRPSHVLWLVYLGGEYHAVLPPGTLRAFWRFSPMEMRKYVASALKRMNPDPFSHLCLTFILLEEWRRWAEPWLPAAVPRSSRWGATEQEFIPSCSHQSSAPWTCPPQRRLETPPAVEESHLLWVRPATFVQCMLYHHSQTSKSACVQAPEQSINSILTTFL